MFGSRLYVWCAYDNKLVTMLCRLQGILSTLPSDYSLKRGNILKRGYEY